MSTRAAAKPAKEPVKKPNKKKPAPKPAPTKPPGKKKPSPGKKPMYSSTPKRTAAKKVGYKTVGTNPIIVQLSNEDGTEREALVNVLEDKGLFEGVDYEFRVEVVTEEAWRVRNEA